jgi:hypothetical protein
MKKIVQLAALVISALPVMAQVPGSPILSFTATTNDVAGAPDSIKIDVLRWSTDAERDQLAAAWTNPAAPAAAGRGGRGGGRATAGRGTGGGAAAAADPAPDTPAVDDAGQDAAPVAATAAGRGARGGGRAGRGGGASAAQTPITPESSLTAALGTAPTVGHLWSSEVAGYSIRYAVKLMEPDGGQRILLITDRRLGAYNDLWKPAGPDAGTGYEFSVIELRLNSKGEGEGKVSLTGKVALDSAAKTLGLENYGGSPVILKNVRRKAP